MASALTMHPSVARPGETVRAQLGRGFGHGVAQYSIAQVGDKIIVTCVWDDAIVSFSPTIDVFTFQAGSQQGVYEVQWIDNIAGGPQTFLAGTATLTIAQQIAIPTVQWEGYAIIGAAILWTAFRRFKKGAQ